ncbi:hypothetical protein ACOMHN_007143 [Nucella lapillus]
MTDWQQQQQSQQPEGEADGSPQRSRTPSCTPGRGSPTLLRALRNKRDSLRSHLSQLHKNITGFKLQPLLKKASLPFAQNEGDRVPEERGEESVGKVKDGKEKDPSAEEGGEGGDVSARERTSKGEKEKGGSCDGASSCLQCLGDNVAGASSSYCRGRSVDTGVENSSHVSTTHSCEGHDSGSEVCLKMTVRGQQCGDDSGGGGSVVGQSGNACGEHAHQHTAESSRQNGHTVHHSSGAATSGTNASQQRKQPNDVLHECNKVAKPSEADDELPLGSEGTYTSTRHSL